MLNVCQQWAEKNRMFINVNKTKIVVFLEDSVTRNARQRFNFTLTPAFPIPLPEATRIQMRQELWLRKHTTSAIKERVRIPASSLGLVVKVKENDTAIVEVAGLGQVELRVQDLTHVSLVITEVDCFKYLGLQLDYALRMEEATKTGVANIRFVHSKVPATLHSLNQLPKRGTHAAPSITSYASPDVAIVCSHASTGKSPVLTHKRSSLTVASSSFSLPEAYFWPL